MAASTQIGQLGEQKARQYLEDQGLSFICANYSAKTGELDLVRVLGEPLIIEPHRPVTLERGQAILPSAVRDL